MVNIVSNKVEDQVKTKVGMVTEQEKDIIERIYERTNSLNELLQTLENLEMASEKKDFLYNKALVQKREAEIQFNNWWRNMCEKYKWKAVEDGIWTINFKTNEIFLGRVSNF